MSTLMTFAFSSQSNWTFETFGFSRMRSATRSAYRRTVGMSSPDTRNCTGKPTGGPFSSRVMFARSPWKSRSKSSISRARSRSRSLIPLVRITNCAKFAFASCWSSGR